MAFLLFFSCSWDWTTGSKNSADCRVQKKQGGTCSFDFIVFRFADLLSKSDVRWTCWVHQTFQKEQTFFKTCMKSGTRFQEWGYITRLYLHWRRIQICILYIYIYIYIHIPKQGPPNPDVAPHMAHQLILVGDNNPAPPLANMLIRVVISTYLNKG